MTRAIESSSTLQSDVAKGSEAAEQLRERVGYLETELEASKHTNAEILTKLDDVLCFHTTIDTTISISYCIFE